MKSIRAKVKQIVAEQYGLLREVLDEDTPYSMGGDSLDHVELTMELEDHFEIEIPDQDMFKMQTVGQVIAYLESRIGA
jgi:acyl carrier protein